MAEKNQSYSYEGDQVHDESIGDSQIFYLNDNQPIYKGEMMVVQQSTTQTKFERFYRSVYIAVERRPNDPKVEKEELFFLVDAIYNEVLYLDLATIDFEPIGRLLKQLYSLAPDVFQVCVTILTNPSSELFPDFRAYVEQVRKDCEPAAGMNMPIHAYLEKELVDHQLSPDKSNEMREELALLQTAVNDGNVRPVRKLLDQLITELPSFKQPLRIWLVETEEVPPAIRVFARKYL